jgi:hypothetical protein
MSVPSSQLAARDDSGQASSGQPVSQIALEQHEHRDLPTHSERYELRGDETIESIAANLYMCNDKDVPLADFARVLQQVNPEAIAPDTAPEARLPKGKVIELQKCFYVARKYEDRLVHITIFRRRRPFFFSL